MSAATGFFSRANLGSKPVVKPEQSRQPQFVDVGGIGDCGFRAIAAAITDKVLYENINSKELSRLLHEHFKYFPDQKPLLRLATATEYLRNMTENGKMAAFIQAFAYTLRQLAVDEIVAHPEYYRGAFYGNEAMPTSPAAMRLPTTWIDESAIAATAKATGFPITVRVVSPEKVIPLCLEYGNVSEKSKPLVMQLQNKHYIPQVNEPARFQSVKSIPTRSFKPQDVETKDPELKEILAKIKADDDRLLRNFERVKSSLMAAVVANEVTRDLLLNIYTEGAYKGNEYFQGYVGIEHGSEHFFNAIKSKQPADMEMVRLELKNPDLRFTTQLVHAIARAVTINQLDENEVFDKIENAQNRGMRLG